MTQIEGIIHDPVALFALLLTIGFTVLVFVAGKGSDRHDPEGHEKP
ncbi:MAG: hypothetical protein PVJ02_04390 [Gemmatimonadota bacterium]|jgi:hypothetical protein